MFVTSNKSPGWATIVDETTGIAKLQQFITFVQCIKAKGDQTKALLDIRHIDVRGATTANLFQLWIDAAAEYNVDVSKYVAFACEGTAAMIGCRNSLFQKLTEQNPITYIIYSMRCLRMA